MNICMSTYLATKVCMDKVHKPELYPGFNFWRGVGLITNSKLHFRDT